MKTSRTEFRPPTSCAAFERAGALIIVLLIIASLSLVAGSLLLTTSSHYHNTYQSASWQEAIVAAEAGVDVAMAELRKRVILGPGNAFQKNWTTADPMGAAYTDSGHAFPTDNQPYVLASHDGEGNSDLRVRVFVDVPGSGVPPVYSTNNFAVPTPDSSLFFSQPENLAQRDPDGYDRSRWWYRIRAVGVAGVSGPPRVNLDARDTLLRRFNFFTDWRTGQAMANPQVSRMVEVIAKPLTSFRNALMADKLLHLNNQNVLVDSYDSSKGAYDATYNSGSKGNIATNGQLIYASHAVVKGDAMTNDGSVTDAENISGAQRTDFFQELTPIQAPAEWSTVPNGGTITSDKTYAASTDRANPTRIKLNGINLPSGGHLIHITGQPLASGAKTPPSTYAKIYVDGDIVTRDDSAIEFGDGVNTIIYVSGNVDVQGDGIVNDSTLPGRLMINGIQPPVNSDGSFPSRTISISTNQDFEGMIYAPSHDIDLNMYAAVVDGGLASPVGPTGIASPASVSSTSNGSNSSGNSGSNSSGNNGSSGSNSSGSNSSGSSNLKLKKPKYKPEKIVSPTQLADHLAGYNGIYGSFVGKTITLEARTHVHYDESLSQLGMVNHYEITNWFEDNLGSNAGTGSSSYWWGKTP